MNGVKDELLALTRFKLRKTVRYYFENLWAVGRAVAIAAASYDRFQSPEGRHEKSQTVNVLIILGLN